jgi:hypothetical protein
MFGERRRGVLTALADEKKCGAQAITPTKTASTLPTTTIYFSNLGRIIATSARRELKDSFCVSCAPPQSVTKLELVFCGVKFLSLFFISGSIACGCLRLTGYSRRECDNYFTFPEVGTLTGCRLSLLPNIGKTSASHLFPNTYLKPNT